MCPQFIGYTSTSLCVDKDFWGSNKSFEAFSWGSNKSFEAFRFFIARALRSRSGRYLVSLGPGWKFFEGLANFRSGNGFTEHLGTEKQKKKKRVTAQHWKSTRGEALGTKKPTYKEMGFTDATCSGLWPPNPPNFFSVWSMV